MLPICARWMRGFCTWYILGSSWMHYTSRLHFLQTPSFYCDTNMIVYIIFFNILCCLCRLILPCWLPNFMSYLGPDKITRYHLPHFRLLSTIERSFECCKAKWKILRSMPQFPLKSMTWIIVACMAWHNFKRNDTNDEEFRLSDENVALENNVNVDDIIAGDVTWEKPSQGTVR